MASKVRSPSFPTILNWLRKSAPRRPPSKQSVSNLLFLLCSGRRDPDGQVESWLIHSGDVHVEEARANFERAWGDLLVKAHRGRLSDVARPTGVDRREVPPLRSRRTDAAELEASGRSMTCPLCEDCGGVCENQSDRPSESERACPCGGAGAPCPRCNAADGDTPPRLPKGDRTVFDKKGWRH